MIQYQTTFHWMLMWPVPCCFGNKGKQIRAHYMSVIGVNSSVCIQRVLGSWDQWFLVPGYVPIGSHAAAGSREEAEFCWLMEAPGWISPCCGRCAGWRDAEQPEVKAAPSDGWFLLHESWFLNSGKHTGFLTGVKLLRLVLLILPFRGVFFSIGRRQTKDKKGRYKSKGLFWCEWNRWASISSDKVVALFF